MTRADDPRQFRPGPVPDAYIQEHRANFRWLSVLRAAFSRGASDKDAVAEANDSVPEALEPSRFPSGDPHEHAPPVAAPVPEPDPRPDRARVEGSDSQSAPIVALGFA